ncbi:MAG: thioredoxin family protein [Candidatus Bathyarchaeota archaeon]|nr:thioredoxin family protein [Candidatus Bathyarchaeota archaeon]
MGHSIEVFTAGCHLCDETIEIVQNTKCNECIVSEYNILEKCESEICLQKAKEYGIKAVPTIVVDGKIAIVGKPTVRQVKDALGL